MLIGTTVCLLSFVGRAGALELVLDGGSEKGCASNWSRSIDTVMGGKSSLTYRCDGDVLEAEGYLSIDGGGFAGVSRYLSESIDLGGGSYSGIEVTYEAIEPSTALPLAIEMRLGERGQGRANFGSVFALLPSSEPGAVGKVTLPLDSFLPRSQFGTGQTGTTLDVSNIGAIAYQLLFQEGDFLFRIVEVKAVSSFSTEQMYADPPTALIDPSPTEVVAVIDAAVARGSFVYNKDYVGQCEKIYAASMRQLADALRGTSDAEANARAALTLAVSRAEDENDASGRAWKLREGLDGVRAIAVSSGDSWSSDGVAPSEAEKSSTFLPQNTAVSSPLSSAPESPTFVTGNTDTMPFPTPTPIADSSTAVAWHMSAFVGLGAWLCGLYLLALQ